MGKPREFWIALHELKGLTEGTYLATSTEPYEHWRKNFPDSFLKVREVTTEAPTPASHKQPDDTLNLASRLNQEADKTLALLDKIEALETELETANGATDMLTEMLREDLQKGKDMEAKLAENGEELRDLRKSNQELSRCVSSGQKKLAEKDAEIERLKAKLERTKDHWRRQREESDQVEQEVFNRLDDRLAAAEALIGKLEGALKHMTRVTYGLEPSMEDGERADRLSRLWLDCLSDARKGLTAIEEWRSGKEQG